MTNAFNLSQLANNTNSSGQVGSAGIITSVSLTSPSFTGTAAAATITATGNITAYFTSDINLKENIREIPDALEKIDKIRGVQFDWKDSEIKERGGEDGYFTRKSDVGVIAQEIEAVLPEVVATRPDGKKAVRYELLCSLLIQAIKELKEEVNLLKAKC